jgi:hypothetical protein
MPGDKCAMKDTKSVVDEKKSNFLSKKNIFVVYLQPITGK